MFLKEADTGRYVNLNRVEVITDDTRGVIAYWRNPEGELDEVPINEWDVDLEFLNATTVPAEPGTFVLEDMYGERPTRSTVVAWIITGQRAYPATCTNPTNVDLHRKDRAILFPDGHVELGGDGWSIGPCRFETLEEFELARPAIEEAARTKRREVATAANARVMQRHAADGRSNVVPFPSRRG